MNVDAENDRAPDAEAEEIVVGALTAGPLTFARILLAHDVVDREPVDPGLKFGVGFRAQAFLEVANSSEQPQGISVAWESLSGAWSPRRTNLMIPPGLRHRTRAISSPLPHAGDFRMLLREGRGFEIQSIAFRAVSR